jgi:hypothetical protein
MWVKKVGLANFLEQALLRFGPGNRHLCLFKIERETFDNPAVFSPSNTVSA